MKSKFVYHTCYTVVHFSFLHMQPFIHHHSESIAARILNKARLSAFFFPASPLHRSVINTHHCCAWILRGCVFSTRSLFSSRFVYLPSQIWRWFLPRLYPCACSLGTSTEITRWRTLGIAVNRRNSGCLFCAFTSVATAVTLATVSCQTMGFSNNRRPQRRVETLLAAVQMTTRLAMIGPSVVTYRDVIVALVRVKAICTGLNF